MANELLVSASLVYSDADGFKDQSSANNFSLTLSTAKMHRVKQSATTSAVAVNLGGISAPGYALFINLDATNYVQILTATSAGSVIARLKPGGGMALLWLDTDMQTPALKANTAACWVDILIASQ